ncbi:unnamed protein product [Boreogadus saida]
MTTGLDYGWEEREVKTEVMVVCVPCEADGNLATTFLGLGMSKVETEWPHEVTTTACCGGNTQRNFLPGEPGARMRRTRGAFVKETELLEFNTGCGLETIAMKPVEKRACSIDSITVPGILSQNQFKNQC